MYWFPCRLFDQANYHNCSACVAIRGLSVADCLGRTLFSLFPFGHSLLVFKEKIDMRVQLLDLEAHHEPLQEEIMAALGQIFQEKAFIPGPEVGK